MHQRPARWSVIRTLASITAALFALVQAPAAGQPPPPPLATGQVQAPQPTGTGRISVRVVAADNGAAVKRARVNLSGMVSPPRPLGGAATATVAIESQVTVSGGVTSGGIVRDGVSQAMAARMVRHESETDDSGTCTFTQLPAALYSVMVMPQGGFVRTGTPQSVRLGDGGSETITVRLGRTGAIVGRVTDDSGDPLMRVQVRALRKEGGRARFTMSSGGMTDDLGQFRLYDLQPGEYLVSAELMQYSSPASAAKIGFAPTYYPGSAAIDQARPVTVRSAQDTGGIEFSLVRAAMGTVTGTAFDAQGNPLVSAPGAGTSVQLTPRGAFYGGGRSAMVEKDGRFTIRSVPPGDYYLSASLFRGQGPQAYREGAFVPVTVNGDDLTIDIRTNKGATVYGRVVFEGVPPTSRPGVMLLNGAPAPRVSIMARPSTLVGPQPPGMGFSTGPAATREDDTFEITGLRGSVLLTASAGNAVLKAVLRGGEDVTGKPLELAGTEQVEDVVVVLSYDTGSLEGVVVDAKGAPAAAPDRTVVVVYPDDAAHWYEGSPFVRMTSVMTEANLRQMPPRSSATPSGPGGLPGPLTPAQEALRWTPVPGGFFLPRLLPGRYLVAVSDDSTASPMSFDRETLERLKARAASVTVRTGEKSRVEVKMPPAPPER